MPLASLTIALLIAAAISLGASDLATLIFAGLACVNEALVGVAMAVTPPPREARVVEEEDVRPE